VATETGTRTERHAGRPPGPALHALAGRLGEVEALDGPSEALAGALSSALGPGRLKDALAGTWLGHALHPLLTDATLGFFLAATALDVVGGEESAPAADRLVSLGLLSALPTAVSGASDWADTVESDPGARRVGLVHAVANGTATACYGASLLARRAGARRLGAALGLAGLGALAAGGHLGGHLSYAQGVGVDRTVFERRPREWTRALAADDLADDEATAADVDGVRVLIARHEGRLHALADRCSHRGGPLHEGRLEHGCVTCPWHGSAFRLEDGSVERGPAAYPQPAYDVRVEDGDVLVRARR
jgi:nitrite reductase/ring-hydroxylating ferredoxin subunit/uncharacterized membrane protein